MLERVRTTDIGGSEERVRERVTMTNRDRKTETKMEEMETHR